MYRYLILIFIISFCSYSQDTLQTRIFHCSDISRCGHNYIYSLGFNYTRKPSLEIMLGRSYSAKWNAFLNETYRVYLFGIEVVPYNNHYVISPKLSYEYSILKYLKIFRSNILYIPTTHAFLYRQELGYTFKGYICLDYSYTFLFNKNIFSNIGHGISLRTILPFSKRKYDRIF